MRAAAFDQEAALTQGVSVGSVFALSWAMAGALAAVAGSLLAISAGVDRQIWIVALVALPAIILGGLDSLEGAVVGGLAVGVVESLVGTYQRDYAPWLGDNFAVVSPYVLMLLVLLAKPYGIFGTPEVRRV
jgi:branched-chain amino acid transport system permease protein